MEGIIKVDPQLLKNTAEGFNTIGGQVTTLTSNMMTLVDGLKSIHEGEAATAFNTKFHALQDDMDKVYRMIQEHVRDLNEMAQNFIRAVDVNVQTAASLPGDVIS